MREQNPNNKWANEVNNFPKKKFKWPVNTWKMGKTFNIFSHQRNTTQNYNEIPSHPSQNG
jgi:hypothetical protein